MKHDKIIIPKYKRNYTYSNEIRKNIFNTEKLDEEIITGEERLAIMKKLKGGD